MNRQTKIAIDSTGLWCSDKASRQYRERKIIRSIAPEDIRKDRGLLLDQRRASSDALNALSDIVQQLGITIHESDGQLGSMPCLVRYAPAKSRIELHRMTPARLDQSLRAVQLEHLWCTAQNVFRHVASTELSQQANDAVVDEVLGHKHPGKDYYGPESSGSLTRPTPVARLVEDWATQMGLRVVKLNESVVEGSYARS